MRSVGLRKKTKTGLHAAVSRRYSRCNPPRIGVAATRSSSGSRSRPDSTLYLLSGGPSVPWRDPKAEFHEELVGNPFLAPRAIRGRHRRFELSHVRWNRWSARCSRFPASKQPEPFAMPANERLRLHDGQQLTPIEELRQRDERNACGVISAPTFHAAFLRRSTDGPLICQRFRCRRP